MDNSTYKTNFTPLDYININKSVLDHFVRTKDKYVHEYVVMSKSVIGEYLVIKCPRCGLHGAIPSNQYVTCSYCLSIVHRQTYTIRYYPSEFKVINFYLFKIYFINKRPVSVKKFDIARMHKRLMTY